MSLSSEIEALIRLLEDPDEMIFKDVSLKLREIGKPAVESLERAWNKYPAAIFQKRIEYLIQDIHLNWVKKNLGIWVTSRQNNLLDGSYIISTFQYPDLEKEDIDNYLKILKKDILSELNNELTPLEKVRVFNHVLFDIHRFSGNYTNYYSPFNNYLNHVLESKKGNPLTLSILYSLLAQETGIPLYGVNLPRNFILAWVEKHSEAEAEVLFYVNPYNKGTVLGRKEVDFFLQQQNIESKSSYLEPCGNIDMIRRLISNLIFAYEKAGNMERLNEIKQLLQILNQDKNYTLPFSE
jgi:regulator of sirC expression with transglutaminase-like and TPR domain